MKRSLAALIFVSLALTGCGSATDGLAFKPPAGWTAFPSFLGFGHMAMWFKKASDNKQDQMLMLIRGQDTSSMNLKNVPQAGIGAVRSQKQSTITICGNQRAQYLSAVGSGHNGEDQSMEMVSTPIGNQSYLAMYIRPQADKPDPDAEAAIRSLCAAKI
jgi:hypothetical protein